MKIVTKIVEELAIVFFAILFGYITFKHDTFNGVVIYWLLKIYVEQLRSDVK